MLKYEKLNKCLLSEQIFYYMALREITQAGNRQQLNGWIDTERNCSLVALVLVELCKSNTDIDEDIDPGLYIESH